MAHAYRQSGAVDSLRFYPRRPAMGKNDDSWRASGYGSLGQFGQVQTSAAGGLGAEVTGPFELGTMA